MNTDCIPAPRTFPALLFIYQENFNPVPPNAFKVFEHAHPVPGPVALVQMFQAGAGEAVANVTVFSAGIDYSVTVPYPACRNGFENEFATAAATRTSVLFSYKSMAQSAIHSAAGDRPRTAHRNPFHLWRSHIRGFLGR